LLVEYASAHGFRPLGRVTFFATQRKTDYEQSSKQQTFLSP
jgi:hypothetical protein